MSDKTKREKSSRSHFSREGRLRRLGSAPGGVTAWRLDQDTHKTEGTYREAQLKFSRFRRHGNREERNISRPKSSIEDHKHIIDRRVVHDGKSSLTPEEVQLTRAIRAQCDSKWNGRGKTRKLHRRLGRFCLRHVGGRFPSGTDIGNVMPTRASRRRLLARVVTTTDGMLN